MPRSGVVYADWFGSFSFCVVIPHATVFSIFEIHDPRSIAKQTLSV